MLGPVRYVIFVFAVVERFSVQPLARRPSGRAVVGAFEIQIRNATLMPNKSFSVRKTSRKYARFAGERHQRIETPTRLTRIDQGQFCRLISLEANSRLCLTIQDRELLNSGSEPLKQLVEHVLGMSLAEILSIYHLTPKMKLSLAYILAYSVW